MAKHDDGSGVIAYDSFDELLADQQRAHDEAMVNMTASQRAIPLGGYACNLTHLQDLGPIFGAIQSVGEVAAWNSLYYGIGDAEEHVRVLAVRGLFEPPNHPKDPASRAWEEDGYATAEDAISDAVANHLGSYERGYLFGFWFSNMETRGELGSAHASVCVQIDAETYEDAWANSGYVSMTSANKISAAMRIVATEQQAREGATEGEGDDDSDVSSS